jgi:hypothetical protein
LMSPSTQTRIACRYQNPTGVGCVVTILGSLRLYRELARNCNLNSSRYSDCVLEMQLLSLPNCQRTDSTDRPRLAFRRLGQSIHPDPTDQESLHALDECGDSRPVRPVMDLISSRNGRSSG